MNFENEKTKFLYRELAKAAINAALQHNKFYPTQYINQNNIKEYWTDLLFEMIEKYKSPQIPKVFVNDICDIKTKLTNKYSDEITCRLSHTQKSLSVFLKYLWCMGKIEEPPVCPIDRKVLWEADLRDKNWTELDDRKEYQDWLKKIEKAAKDKAKSIAQWELEIWNNQE